jgi:hypothetical protein
MTPRRAAMAATGRITGETCRASAGFLNRCELPVVTASIPPPSALSASQQPRALNPSLWPLSQLSSLIATLPYRSCKASLPTLGPALRNRRRRSADKDDANDRAPPSTTGRGPAITRSRRKSQITTYDPTGGGRTKIGADRRINPITWDSTRGRAALRLIMLKRSYSRAALLIFI